MSTNFYFSCEFLPTLGRFHQTFFAKRKVTSAQRLAKKLLFDLTNLLPHTLTKFDKLLCYICELKYMSCLPYLCAFCEMLCAKKATQLVCLKKPRSYVGEIDPLLECYSVRLLYLFILLFSHP